MVIPLTILTVRDLLKFFLFCRNHLFHIAYYDSEKARSANLQRLVFIFSGGESICLKIVLAEMDAVVTEVKFSSSSLLS